MRNWSTPARLAGLAGVALSGILMSGCMAHHNASGQPAATVSPVASEGTSVSAASQPASVTTTPSGTPSGAAASTAAQPGQPAQATQPAGGAAASATLASVGADLDGIDKGSNQVDRDLSAGDSARAQNDNG